MKTLYKFIVKDMYPLNVYLLLVITIVTYSLCVERRYYGENVVNGKSLNRIVKDKE